MLKRDRSYLGEFLRTYTAVVLAMVTVLIPVAHAQVAGNGGAVSASVTCANASLTCNGSAVSLNVANPNTFTAKQTIPVVAMVQANQTAPSIGIDGDASGRLNLYSAAQIALQSSTLLQGHYLENIGREGSLTACSGTGTFTNAGNDFACKVTLASGAATMTFNAAFAAPPVAVCTDTTTAAAVKCTTTTTTLTIAGTSSDVINVVILGDGGV